MHIPATVRNDVLGCTLSTSPCEEDRATNKQCHLSAMAGRQPGYVIRALHNGTHTAYRCAPS